MFSALHIQNTQVIPSDSDPLCSGLAESHGWYVVMTKSLAEESAKVNLERQGYHVYFPRLLQRKAFKGRRQDCVTALFPRYLFLRLNIGGQSLAPIRSTMGVAGVVRFGSEYAMVSEEIVKGILANADPLSGLHRLQRQTMVVPGDSVRLVTGAFAGLMGIFEREIGEDRVSVLFGMLGRQVALNFLAAEVEPQ